MEKKHERVKKGVDKEELRRKRVCTLFASLDVISSCPSPLALLMQEATTVQLRKDKKDDSIQKRRRDVGGGSTKSEASLSGRKQEQVGALPDPAFKLKLDALPEDIQLLHSDNPAEQLEATTRFRKLLSIERNPPIAEVIAAGAVPRLVQYCQCCAARRKQRLPSGRVHECGFAAKHRRCCFAPRRRQRASAL